LNDASDIAWAAGLFEGEGCFSLHDGRRCRAQLAMTDRDIVERFHAVMGFGTIRDKASTNPRHRHQWMWAANSRAEFERTVTLFRPWLGERRLARAQEILEHLVATDYKEMTCAYCGKTETVRVSMNSVRKRYCTRACKSLAYQKRNLPSRAAYQREWRKRRARERELAP
jgi:hypothetical protein